MGAKNIIPPIIKEGDSNEKLINELTYRLEKELQKSQDDIDTIKIDYIITLLNQLENPINQQETMRKEEFAEKYLHKHIKISHKKNYEKNRSFLNVRIAVVLLLVVIFLCICRFISIRASNK